MILPMPKGLLYRVLLAIALWFGIPVGNPGSPGIPTMLASVTTMQAQVSPQTEPACPPQQQPRTPATTPVVDFGPLVEVSTVAGIFSLLVALVWSTGLVLAARAKYRKEGGT